MQLYDKTEQGVYPVGSLFSFQSVTFEWDQSPDFAPCGLISEVQSQGRGEEWVSELFSVMGEISYELHSLPAR